MNYTFLWKFPEIFPWVLLVVMSLDIKPCDENEWMCTMCPRKSEEGFRCPGTRVMGAGNQTQALFKSSKYSELSLQTHDERILTFINFRAQAGFPTDPKMSWSISDRGELHRVSIPSLSLIRMRTEGAIQPLWASFLICKMGMPLLSGSVWQIRPVTHVTCFLGPWWSKALKRKPK